MDHEEKFLIIANARDYTRDIVPTTEQNVAFSYKYRKSFLQRGLRRVWLHYHWPCSDIWYGCQGVDFSQYDTILIYECMGAADFIAFVRKQNPVCRIIYWQWNTVAKLSKIAFFSGHDQFLELLSLRDKKGYSFEIWSFDKGDCNKYDLRYNNQVAVRYPLHIQEPEWDLFFCGLDKQRFSMLNDFLDSISELNLSKKILIQPDDHSYIYPEIDGMQLIKAPIPYHEMIDCLQKASIIIDLVQDGQEGLTWRPLEAMFYRKKLVTNFSDIVDYEFYEKDNIFILGKDEDFLKFMHTPYKPIPEKIVENYEYKGWIRGFQSSSE